MGLRTSVSTAVIAVVVLVVLLFIGCLDYGAMGSANNDGTSNIGDYPGKCNQFN
jgi:hypothetical protein